jgi:hypothetical protein
MIGMWISFNEEFTYLISCEEKNNLRLMQFINLILVLAIFTLSKGFGQPERELEKFGFIEIKTDSMDVPFFIDGVYVGSHPLNTPVPVIPGFHEVSYIPPDIQRKKIRENLSEGIKRVYVAENDTLDVFLYYDHYLSQVHAVKTQLLIQNTIGLSLIGVLFYIVLSIF